MRAITKALWAVILVPAVLWLAVEPTALQADTFFFLRNNMVQISGVLTIFAMSAAMILALRPTWLESRLDGLDKMYRLHKWLGIAGLSLAVTHWLWAKGPKWAVGWGLLERPQRGPRPELPPGIEQVLNSWRGVAEGVGEWAFYAMALLMVLALIKYFPYRRFFQTHRLLAVGYLVMVFHSVVLTKFSYWSTPLGAVLAMLLVTGTIAAVVVLLRRVGAGRKVGGHVVALRDFPQLRCLEVRVALETGWKGHQAGQFAFVTFDKKEGAHPFTIASSWDGKDNTLSFVIKELGDHTAALRRGLALGQAVSVEGPYGRFTFKDDRPRQIWVGGGIGITPFLARARQLAAGQGRPGQQIDLIHTTVEEDAQALAELHGLADQAGIRLHVMVDGRDGRLDGEKLGQMVPGWDRASVWFCGPAGFGHALRGDLARHGMAVSRRFHQEMFAMR
ncbi:ferric reductase-like transmembrane domain-containing protein [Magnetospirillum sp. 64-120]|uniref:ferredoxin reductase family protein n=1 Tax=Magnetospirillum sp. 64-120 TaxID=1895778 RepID=UPI0009269B83|nr:ferric reductase-like transmembrane domain-containing protein [Magnetospirillum sp. 64-120]OJX65810.1 MAG: ferric reductase [Magnetospirillum sp. 64-120]